MRLALVQGCGFSVYLFSFLTLLYNFYLLQFLVSQFCNGFVTDDVSVLLSEIMSEARNLTNAER